MNYNKKSGATLQEIALMKKALREIPTQVSELENDIGYLTLDTLPIYEGEII